MRTRYPLAVLAAAFIMAASRAWACDDAFITFRVISQFLEGHGPVFNVGERVQVFTHPLWFLVLAAWSALGASLFPGVIWLSLAVFGCGLVFVYLAFRDKPLALAVALAMMTFSQSMMDFATSGLETPLTFALFAGAVWALRSGRRRAALVLLALLPLNRVDLLPWALPFAWLAAEPGMRGRARALAIFCAPALAWIAFSTVYYGEPLPNTAFAKLGVPMLDRLDQGLAYVAGSFAHDPGAMAVVLVAAAFAWRARAEEAPWIRAAAASALVGCLYPVWAGGDFMLGRFILPALWASIVLMLAAFPKALRNGTPAQERRAAAFALACLAAFLLVTGHSTTNLWLHMKNESLMRSVGFAGATDERRVYLPWLGAYAPERLVVAARGEGPAPTAQPLKVAMLGQLGYLGRGDQPMIDVWALADPFLARFAPLRNSRPGHAYRPFRVDFPRWREAQYRFGDPRLDALAGDLRLAHMSGDLWSAERAGAIARLPMAAPIPQDALQVSDEGDALRIDIKPWRLFRPWPDATSHVVWLRLHDAGRLRYRAPLPTALDRDCAPVAVAPLSDDAGGFEVAAGDSVTMRCPRNIVGRNAILLRIGALQTIAGKSHIEYDEAIEAVRPALWWITGLPEWLVQGWTEKPKPAATVAIVLLAFAAFAWRAARGADRSRHGG
jgi:arabinofuranosyltransferase